jgi:superfamily II DNA/RNA helicase
MRAFHTGAYDVLIQVKKASEGFDAPAVSVLLKLDAVFSKEPVIQQLGRGLRFNHELPAAENVLHVFIGRDPRLGSIIEHLEREAPPLALRPNGEAFAADEDPRREEADEPGEPEEEREGIEILEVVEAGDAYLDETGRFVEGQQMTLFGVEAPAPRSDLVVQAPSVEVVDLFGELQEAIAYCKTWTNRAAKERARRFPGGENHHAALNMTYSRESGRRGALSTSAEYRAKGDWMKRKYLELMR